MAILIESKSGWIVSHEDFIKTVYNKTSDHNKIISYCLNPLLFDIKIPFVRKKCKDYLEKTFIGDVANVKNAYENLYESFLTLRNPLPVKQLGDNNSLAKSLADNFYCQLSRHPQCNFLGGNRSSEALVSKIAGEFYLIPENSLFYCYDVIEISKYLSNKKFDFILMDPPWWNKYVRRKKKRNSSFGYDMLYDKDLSNIPINLLLNEDGIVGVWCTSAPSHINAILNELFPAWHIEYVTQWFWLKITKFMEPICEFRENLEKQPFERIIFGKKINSMRSFLNPEENKVIMSVPSAIHSHKPPLCDILKNYLPENPHCLELFARYLLPGWTSYGKEVLKLQHMSLYKEVSS